VPLHCCSPWPTAERCLAETWETSEEFSPGCSENFQELETAGPAESLTNLGRWQYRPRCHLQAPTEMHMTGRCQCLREQKAKGPCSHLLRPAVPYSGSVLPHPKTETKDTARIAAETERRRSEDQLQAGQRTNDGSAAFDSSVEEAMEQVGDLPTLAFAADDRIEAAAPACKRVAAGYTVEEAGAGADRDACAVVAAQKEAVGAESSRTLGETAATSSPQQDHE
jgi:hypothetical protein